MCMIISKEQYKILPDEYKKYFNLGGGCVSGDVHKNIHPT